MIMAIIVDVLPAARGHDPAAWVVQPAQNSQPGLKGCWFGVLFSSHWDADELFFSLKRWLCQLADELVGKMERMIGF